MQYHIVFGVLLLALILLIWGKFRHDLVAFICLILLVLMGVIPPSDAFVGFVNPAVITVAAVLVIGKGLESSGLINLLGKWVMRVGSSTLLQILSLSLLVAVASAFMNNVAALAIMMPIAIHMARKNNYPASYILMPIAFASLLGGMTTLMGTPPNIIIASIRSNEVGEPFGMFDYTPVGIVIALSGILFISLIGWRFLPKRRTSSIDHLFNIDNYVTELEVLKDSRIVGQQVRTLTKYLKPNTQVKGLIRNEKQLENLKLDEILLENDIIILETDAENLQAFMEDTHVALVGDKQFREGVDDTKHLTIIEAVVMGDSFLLGRTASSMRMRSRYDINLLAVARKEQPIHRRMDHVIFRTGDVLLLQGRTNLINNTISSLGCLPLAKRALRIGYKKKIPLALGIFIPSIIAIAFGAPVEISFSIAALLMVLLGVLPLKDLYTSIDWPIIVLLGAMIPMGVALETSGGAALIASVVLDFGKSFPPWAMILTVLVITMFLSDVINNAATVVLMAPIAISVAKGLDFSVDPFLMAVAIGASCAFLTPIGHQSNTLVMGSGGYKFSDYWRMGLPLEILIAAIGVPLIMHFWPL